MPQFFISYKRGAREDFVDELEKKLLEADLRPFRDIRIKAGEEWKKEIELALKDCYAVILVLTQKAVREPKYIAHECSYAMGIGKKIIPIAVETIDFKKAPIGVDERQIMSPAQLNFWDELIDRLNEIKAQYSDEVPLPVSLAAMALNGPNPDDRKQAIEMLRSYDYPNYNHAVVKALGDSLKHGYVDVRVGAAIALAVRTNYENKNVLPALREGYVICKKITSEPLLKAFEIPYNIEVLQELFSSQKLIDEKGLLRAIYEMEDNDLKQSLWGIYDNRSPVELRLQVIKCIGNIGNRDDSWRLESLISNLYVIGEDYERFKSTLQTALSNIKDRQSGNFGTRLYGGTV